MFGHQPLVVYLFVSECICVGDIARRMMKADYEMFTSMSLRYNSANNAQFVICRVTYYQQGVDFWW